MFLLIRTTYNFIGSISVGNGLWMIFSATSWYQYMPVAASDTGPMNAHFVHDVGLAFLLAGAGAIWCAYKMEGCFPIHLFTTLFIAGHAIIHVVEISIGDLPSSHWLIDFPLIFLPALILILITPYSYKAGQGNHANG